MNIGIVINTSWNIFNFRQGLINALLQQGHKVVAIAPKDKYSAQFHQIGIDFVPLRLDAKSINPIKDLKLILELRNIYKEQKLDVVLHYTIKPNIYGTLATLFLPLSVINNVSGLGTTFIRENIVSKLVRMLYKLSFKRANHVFFQNNDDAALFQHYKLVRNNQWSVLPGSGVPLDKIPFSSKEYFLNRRIFFMPARLLIDKGVGEFVEAARAMKKEFGDQAIFVLSGITEPNPSLGFDRNEVKKWEKEGIITYLGHIDHVLEYMKEVDVVVLPSYREGTPRTLLEAACIGRPIIASDAPGCKEVVINQLNGWLCEVKNAKSLYNCMKNMQLAPNEVLQSMGIESRKLAQERFDEQIVLTAYLQIIQKTAKWK